jgi:imidazolonepropionase-like amidohydrolase
MKKWFVTLLLLLIALPPFILAQTDSSAKAIAITNATIIDVTGKPAQRAMTVVVQGELIAAVGKTGKVQVPKDAQVIDATGKFLIPGLWDMHVHSGAGFGELYIANGVTGVRDMNATMSAVKNARDAIAAGRQVGPRIVASSRIVDGPQPVWPGSIAVKNPEEGRQAVSTARAEGAEFLKVYSLLSRESYFAIADEAKKQGIPFAGHVPNTVTVAEASDAGHKSMEHLYGILISCSKREDEIRKTLAATPVAERRQVQNKLFTELDYDETKAKALFARFVKNQTWQSPTMTVLRSMASLDLETFISDPRLKYMPPSFKNFWNPKNDFRLKTMTAEDYAFQRKMLEKHKYLVGKMRRAGVEFIAGTDVMNPFCFPGFSLHDELALYVESGFTALEALQTATINPARYLGMEKTLGTIEAGKLADLVVLDANPLQEIRNTTKVSMVVAQGRLFASESIKQMLEKAESASRKSSN